MKLDENSDTNPAELANSTRGEAENLEEFNGDLHRIPQDE